MQDLENDMDELFRKAVDQITLFPENRWNEISGKLTGNSIVSPTSYKKNKNGNINGAGRKVLLTAIFMIVLATIINHEEKISLVNPIGKIENSDKEINTIPERPTKEKLLPATYKSGVQKKTVAVAKLNYTNEIALSQNQSGFLLENQLTDPEAPAITKSISSKRISDTANSNVRVLELRGDISQTNRPVEFSESVKKTSSLTPYHLNSSHNRGFYFGLAMGPILSQIKTQGYNKPGFDIGILVGYKFNRKISIETGLLHTTQYYSSSGKYYDQVTGGNTTNSLDGSRTAFEIPFKLNYNILQSRTGNFFISGGFSSYVGANDKIIINLGDNTPRPPQKLDYGVASYLPSYLDFSIGYEYRIGKIAQIRLEPYVEIPMSSTAGNTVMNAGGSLQIVNAGLHFAITRFIR